MSVISLGNLFDAALAPFSLGKEQKAVAPKIEKESTGDPMQDYIVELSETAKRLAAEDNPFSKALEKLEQGAGSGDEEESASDNIIDDLKRRIEELQQEIREIQSEDMPDEQKKQMLSMKQSELVQLQLQLMKALEEGLDAPLQSQSITAAGGLT